MTLDEAKDLINEFCEDEHECDADFSNLHNVDLAYTELGDCNQWGIQVSVDLVDYMFYVMINEYLVEVEKYDSLDDMKNVFECLNFEGLVYDSYPTEISDLIYNEAFEDEIEEVLKKYDTQLSSKYPEVKARLRLSVTISELRNYAKAVQKGLDAAGFIADVDPYFAYGGYSYLINFYKPDAYYDEQTHKHIGKHRQIAKDTVGTKKEALEDLRKFYHEAMEHPDYYKWKTDWRE